MASSASSSRRSLGLFENARKNKAGFIQLFAMTGVFFLSIKSLGQKYYIHELQEDIAALKDEDQALTDRMNSIKRDLLHEASLEPTGVFASRLHRLFRDED